MPLSNCSTLFSCPPILSPDLGDLSWEKNRHLFRWAPLLDDRPAATANPETVEQKDITDWGYNRVKAKDGQYPDRPEIGKNGSDDAVKAPGVSAQDLRDRVWTVRPLVYSGMIGDNPPGFEDHIGPIPMSYARPNAIGADVAVQQHRGVNPHADRCRSLKLEWIGNWDNDQDALIDGACWVAEQLADSLKFIVPRSIIETVGPSGTGQILKGHLQARMTDSEIDAAIAGLRHNCNLLCELASRKLGMISYEALLWADAACKPALDSSGQTLDQYSLINLATGVAGLQNLKKMGDAVSSFARGVKNTVDAV